MQLQSLDTNENQHKERKMANTNAYPKTGSSQCRLQTEQDFEQEETLQSIPVWRG
jgi:hypothetical protein